ncbi:hypothetical protein [Streptomyces yaizuensis]|uniref:PD-(D/E)XK nuclease family protein n=1 Tax=Streptomyces yaizuensis TaxID=2989713 RepID=A0ABQ5NT56_9ACTN|nr:hypothetical protein [Streptomyces sp. YSPA8]GLF93552.1 PD-(D/E)XK nuclease family protein [Streptomyces sp. YSPA8]
MSESLDSGPPPQAPTTPLRQRLAELRGPAARPRPLDARSLAALAANPGCSRRALLDGAGVDKAALAAALGSPAGYGQSQFAFMRGNAFEARVKSDGGAELMRLMGVEGGRFRLPELTAAGPEGRAARTSLALREATADGGWTLLDHPMLLLEVAGSPVCLEPDAVVVHPDGRWTVVEIKSFPMIDGSADAAKVGAAARQAAVYVLALERVAAHIPGAEVRRSALLVCPKDFSNLPTGSLVDVRKQCAVTDRQLRRLTRIEDIAATLPEGCTFDPERPADELTAAVESVAAAYAPDCLAACELAFHCRDRARARGAVTALGRATRGELGTLTTVDDVLAAARGTLGDVADPAVAALRRAAALRAEALGHAVPAARRPGETAAPPGEDVQATGDDRTAHDDADEEPGACR